MIVHGDVLLCTTACSTWDCVDDVMACCVKTFPLLLEICLLILVMRA